METLGTEFIGRATLYRSPLGCCWSRQEFIFLDKPDQFPASLFMVVIDSIGGYEEALQCILEEARRCRMQRVLLSISERTDRMDEHRCEPVALIDVDRGTISRPLGSNETPPLGNITALAVWLEPPGTVTGK